MSATVKSYQSSDHSTSRTIPLAALTEPLAFVQNTNPELLRSQITKAGHNLAFVLAAKIHNLLLQKRTDLPLIAAFQLLAVKVPALFVTANAQGASVLSQYPTLVKECIDFSVKFELDDISAPTLRESDGCKSLGCMVDYSKALSVVYLRPNGFEGLMHEYCVQHKRMPKGTDISVSTTLSDLSPKDASFVGLRGLLNVLSFYLKEHQVNPICEGIAYLPGCATLQELPLFRELFPEVKVVAVDPFLASFDVANGKEEVLKQLNSVVREDRNSEYVHDSAGSYKVPDDVKVILIRHPHPDDFDVCWENVFNKVVKIDFSVFVMTHYHECEMQKFYGELCKRFEITEPTASTTDDSGKLWEEKGLFFYQGKSPGALRFVVAKGEPESGVDLYYTILLRPPQLPNKMEFQSV